MEGCKRLSRCLGLVGEKVVYADVCRCLWKVRTESLVVRSASGTHTLVVVSVIGTAEGCPAISVLLWERVGIPDKGESTH